MNRVMPTLSFAAVAVAWTVTFSPAVKPTLQDSWFWSHVCAAWGWAPWCPEPITPPPLPKPFVPPPDTPECDIYGPCQ